MSRAYYNENDASAAAWLRELITSGLIAPGDVDERSILDVKPNDLAGYGQCHFFAGIGGWSLALRSAGVPDHFPIWTGSCPCQPFSAAGKRLGFADDRHLWPYWRYLIAQRRPSIVFGEQVAHAAEWLRLVRGDLEAMEYAVGAMPVEAASAGADHLRDRFWFVANDGRGRRDGQGERQAEQPGRAEAVGAGRAGSDMGDGGGARLALRPIAEEQRRDIWQEGPTAAAPGDRGESLADADIVERRIGDEQPAGQLAEHDEDQGARDGRDMVDAACIAEREPDDEGDTFATGGQARAVSGGTGDIEWVVGADGKARRVKPGIRLLVDGFPSRVGLLRGFGNAIDPRPAAAFIRASIEALTDLQAGEPRGRNTVR